MPFRCHTLSLSHIFHSEQASSAWAAAPKAFGSSCRAGKSLDSSRIKDVVGVMGILRQLTMFSLSSRLQSHSLRPSIVNLRRSLHDCAGRRTLPRPHFPMRMQPAAMPVVGVARPAFCLGRIALCPKSRDTGMSNRRSQTLPITRCLDTQGSPTACDSPSSVANGRNRENSAPLRVPHLDQTCSMIDSVKRNAICPAQQFRLPTCELFEPISQISEGRR